MSKIWLKEQTFEELWALTHNIRVRMQSNIKKAAVTVSGSGKRACVNILLPATAAAGYNGNFKVTLNSDNKFDISAGYLNRNGEFLTVEAFKDLEPAAGILCLKSTIEEGKWTDPEFIIQEEPDTDAYPIAEVTIEEEGQEKTITFRQFPVTVAVILMAKRCPLTTGVTNV